MFSMMSHVQLYLRAHTTFETHMTPLCQECITCFDILVLLIYLSGKDVTAAAAAGDEGAVQAVATNDIAR